MDIFTITAVKKYANERIILFYNDLYDRAL
jgi:hypothetical protein